MGFVTTGSGHLRQCRFGLRQPEGHLHSTVESNRSGQGGAGLLPLAGGGVQGPKAQVTVGLQGTHAEALSQGEGVLVVRGGVHHVWSSTAGGNLAEEPQRPRLLAPHFAMAGVRKRTLGQPVGLLHIPGKEICLPAGDRIEGESAFLITCSNMVTASVVWLAKA